ncbi:hypothetical protein B1R32_11929 [Abditibacterium utsteinense]|uniref:Uncharacterized protein n=1 Tax=Abditibacterium utsteinense TaxID=1960156 RepID=A0A2S8SQ47_9BACT|nr:hypothetical protein B1R32_11929 [Abditibacterium utsteinense]
MFSALNGLQNCLNMRDKVPSRNYPLGVFDCVKFFQQSGFFRWF